MSFACTARPTRSPASHARRGSTISAHTSRAAAGISPSRSAGPWMGEFPAPVVKASGTATAARAAHRPPMRQPSTASPTSSSAQYASGMRRAPITGSMPVESTAATGSRTAAPVEMRGSNGVSVEPESADAESVFGARQPGVRLVQVVDADGRGAPVAHSEDHVLSLPGSSIDQHICDTGIVPVTVDACGNPLDVGREQRLFTPKQRIALAIRDGGCRWRACDRPASYCESHHIDEWHRDQGRTDIDRGILLCRYHHMTLHHGGWWITRDGTGDFVLHHPSGETFPMRPRAALSYAWAGIDPPPKRFRPAA